MEIEKKYISRKNWKRVTERIDAFEKIENKDVKGIASIICIKKVKEPSLKTIGLQQCITRKENVYNIILT